MAPLFAVVAFLPTEWRSGAPWMVLLVLAYGIEAIVYRLATGPGALLFRGDVRILVIVGVFGFVAIIQMIEWIRDG